MIARRDLLKGATAAALVSLVPAGIASAMSTLRQSQLVAIAEYKSGFGPWVASRPAVTEMSESDQWDLYRSLEFDQYAERIWDDFAVGDAVNLLSVQPPPAPQWAQGWLMHFRCVRYGSYVTIEDEKTAVFEADIDRLNKRMAITALSCLVNQMLREGE